MCSIETYNLTEKRIILYLRNFFQINNIFYLILCALYVVQFFTAIPFSTVLWVAIILFYLRNMQLTAVLNPIDARNFKRIGKKILINHLHILESAFSYIGKQRGYSKAFCT